MNKNEQLNEKDIRNCYLLETAILKNDIKILLSLAKNNAKYKESESKFTKDENINFVEKPFRNCSIGTYAL